MVRADVFQRSFMALLLAFSRGFVHHLPPATKVRAVSSVDYTIGKRKAEVAALRFPIVCGDGRTRGSAHINIFVHFIPKILCGSSPDSLVFALGIANTSFRLSNLRQKQSGLLFHLHPQ